MNKQEFLDLCGAYALGALDGEELILFREAMTHADAEMKAALAEALRAADHLSLAAPEAVPSPVVKDRLMKSIRAQAAATPERPAPRTTRAPASPGLSWRDRLFGAGVSPRPAFALAFSLLVAVAGVFAYALSLRGALEHREAALAERDRRITALSDSLEQRDAMLEVLRAREMHLVALGGTEANPAAYGRILWDAERKTAVLQVSLPPEPEGMDYQLWVIRDQKPVDAGVFQVAARGGSPDAAPGGLYRIERLAETDVKRINAFAVTLEPKGGVPQPTGAMQLVGGLEI